MNGKPVQLRRHAKMLKKSEDEWNLEATLAAEHSGPAPGDSAGRRRESVAGLLRPGRNVLALSLLPTNSVTDVLLESGLYEIPPPKVPQGVSGAFAGALVIRQAVVCDLCSGQAGGPACVKACPHEAAFRFDARSGVPAW